MVRSIPRGVASSYGQIARLAGHPRNARLVGRLLGEAGSAEALPWHRVLNARGESSLPQGSAGRAEQWRRLREEGVEVSNERVNLRRYGWRPGPGPGSGDSPLLD